MAQPRRLRAMRSQGSSMTLDVPCGMWLRLRFDDMEMHGAHGSSLLEKLMKDIVPTTTLTRLVAARTTGALLRLRSFMSYSMKLMLIRLALGFPLLWITWTVHIWSPQDMVTTWCDKSTGMRDFCIATWWSLEWPFCP